MNQNTGKETEMVEQFQSSMRDGASLRGGYQVWVHRADGTVEHHKFNNIVLAVGLDFLAARAVGASGANSAMNYIAIGTVTAQPSLGSVNFGEIARKAGALVASSKEVIILSNTWGGASDSLTAIALGSAVVCNHASSGQGVYLNFSNSVNTTLQASDLLRIQAEIQVGSHNL